MHDNIGAGLRAGPCRAGQHSLESARSVGARLLQEGLIRDEILGAGGAAGNMHGCVFAEIPVLVNHSTIAAGGS